MTSGRYVALGSSMAAGPGIRPRAPGAPLGSGRSAVNYPHLVARRLGYGLVDVTFSGATTAHILTDEQRGQPVQVDALDGTESLVTVTIGGNDVGYVPYLYTAGLPGFATSLPLVGARLRDALDPVARDEALERVGASLTAVGAEIRRRAPQATVMFVDYLTLLPPRGIAAPPLSEARVEVGRHIADTLKRHTETAAAKTGCQLVRASDASVEHHPWSAEAWTTRFGLPVPGRAAPLHPNKAGMGAVADMIVARLS